MLTLAIRKLQEHRAKLARMALPPSSPPSPTSYPPDRTHAAPAPQTIFFKWTKKAWDVASPVGQILVGGIPFLLLMTAGVLSFIVGGGVGLLTGLVLGGLADFLLLPFKQNLTGMKRASEYLSKIGGYGVAIIVSTAPFILAVLTEGIGALVLGVPGAVLGGLADLVTWMCKGPQPVRTEAQIPASSPAIYHALGDGSAGARRDLRYLAAERRAQAQARSASHPPAAASSAPAASPANSASNSKPAPYPPNALGALIEKWPPRYQ